MKIFLYAGDDDDLSSVIDVEILEKTLTFLKPENRNKVEKVVLNDFDHMCFLWGRESVKLYHEIFMNISLDT